MNAAKSWKNPKQCSDQQISTVHVVNIDGASASFGFGIILVTQEESFRELGLERTAPLSFDVLVCLKRHCSLMKDLSMEEAHKLVGTNLQL